MTVSRPAPQRIVTFVLSPRRDHVLAGTWAAQIATGAAEQTVVPEAAEQTVVATGTGETVVPSRGLSVSAQGVLVRTLGPFVPAR